MAIKVEQLQAKVQSILEEYVGDINDVAEISIKEIAEKTVETLKSTSPKDKGSYAKTWTYEEEIKKRKGEYGTHVYNKKNYRLTHLLENGHDLVSAKGKLYGRTKAIPHIYPAEQQAIKEYEEKLKGGINAIK